MRISDWSSDVCSSDLALAALATAFGAVAVANLGIRWTRPRAVAAGFVAAVIGCGLVFASVLFQSLVWLFAASLAIGVGRSAERGVGKGGVSTGRTRWAPAQ